MKLKPRHISLVFSVLFAALLGDVLRKVFSEHDLSRLPFLVINLGFMVSCYLAGYLMDEEDPGEKS